MIFTSIINDSTLTLTMSGRNVYFLSCHIKCHIKTLILLVNVIMRVFFAVCVAGGIGVGRGLSFMQLCEREDAVPGEVSSTLLRRGESQK